MLSEPGKQGNGPGNRAVPPSLFLYLILVLSILVLAACGGNKEATLAGSADISELLQKFEVAYQAGDFDNALNWAQQSIQAAPLDGRATKAYRRAALAQAGNDYLQHLPEDRYRLSPEQFVRDEAEHHHYFVVDVREPGEYDSGHIEDAINLPLRQLLQNLDSLPEDKDTPILVYCRSMKRSTHTLVILRQLGYKQVFNLKGGYLAFREYIEENPLPDNSKFNEDIDYHDDC